MPEDQIPEKKRPDDFELSSKVKGHKRFQTANLRSLTKELDLAAKMKKRALIPFVSSMFKQFYSKRRLWQTIINFLSELECLSSLAIFAITAGGPLCKPSFIETQGRRFFELKQMRHPGVIPVFRPGQPAQSLINSS